MSHYPFTDTLTAGKETKHIEHTERREGLRDVIQILTSYAILSSLP